MSDTSSGQNFNPSPSAGGDSNDGRVEIDPHHLSSAAMSAGDDSNQNAASDHQDLSNQEASSNQEGSSTREPSNQEPSDHKNRFPHWPVWSVPVAILVALGLLLVGQFVVIFVCAIATGQITTKNSPGILLGGTFIQDLCIVIAPILVCAYVGGRISPQQFGIKATSIWRSAGWIALIAFIYMVVSGIWAQIVDIPKDEVVSKLGVEQSDVALVAAMILIIIAAPLAEEFFFRGFMFTSLRRSWGAIPAAIAVGVLFGAVHISNGSWVILIPLAILGFLLCLLYVWSGSLIPCIVLHTINNAAAFGIYKEWTWQIPLLVVGAVALILAITLPLARSSIGFSLRPRSAG